MNTEYPTDLKILALDFGTSLGWATLANGIVDSGCQSFSRKTGRKTINDEHPGTVFLKFQQWLRTMIQDFRPDGIAYEEVMYLSSLAAPRTLNGLRGVMFLNAAYSDIPVQGFAPTQLKKFATGAGNAGKDLILASSYASFPDQTITTHDQADALFVLHLYLQFIDQLDNG